MKLLFASLMFIAPSFGKAAITNISEYGSIACEINKANTKLQKFTAELMTISVDDHFARFQQVRFAVAGVQVQYQVLIEETASTAKDGSVQLLQNLMIDGQETSVEISTKDITKAQAQNGDYSVACEVKK